MNPETKRKKVETLYCYVDETGQDTLGKFFIVAVVVSRSNRDSLVAKLQEFEQRSGKGKVKWMEARHRARFDYMRAVLSSPSFKHTLYFSTFKNTTKYMALTVLSTAKAIVLAAPERSATTVYVDGLPKSRVRWFGTELRHLSVRNSRVRGVRQQQADSLMCLADAVAGFVRLALGVRDRDATELFERAKQEGYLAEA